MSLTKNDFFEFLESIDQSYSESDQDLSDSEQDDLEQDESFHNRRKEDIQNPQVDMSNLGDMDDMDNESESMKNMDSDQSQDISDDMDADHHSLHIVQNEDKSGWVAKTAESQEILSESESKEEVIDKAREIAKEWEVRIFVHSEHGKIEKQEDYGGHKTVREQ